nr:hypothetical protein [Tanacetum cinerariifolium]
MWSTHRDHRTPTLTVSLQGKKRKQSVIESNTPRKTHKITIKKRKQSTPLIPFLRDDKERDAIAEATLLSLALHKTILATKAQVNVAKVPEKLYEEETKKMVEGEENEESYASAFADFVFNDDVDDSGTKIEPKSHKKHPNNVTNEDEEIEKEKKDKEILEVLDNCNKVLYETTFAKSNDMIRKEMPRLVNLAVNKDHEVDPINAQEMIAKEFATHGPKIIKELFQKHIHNTTLNLYPTPSTSTARKSYVDL